MLNIKFHQPHDAPGTLDVYQVGPTFTSFCGTIRPEAHHIPGRAGSGSEYYWKPDPGSYGTEIIKAIYHVVRRLSNGVTTVSEVSKGSTG